MNRDKKKPKLSVKDLAAKTGRIKKYLWLIAVLFFILIYGYVLISAKNFSNQQPTQTQIDSELKTSPQQVIDPTVIVQLENMQNNSVSVQALFNQARQNPFQ